MNFARCPYASYADGDFAIGKLSLLLEQSAKINLDAFLTRHAAILGQTGGGKSWTVATLIQKMCAFKQATIVLFDLHGEYAGTFGASADVIRADDLELTFSDPTLVVPNRIDRHVYFLKPDGELWGIDCQILPL